MTIEFGSAVLPGRYWDKVSVVESGCWIWTAATDRKGYGRFGIGGRSAGTAGAHVWMASLAHGAKPSADHMVMHSCETPPCVNPDHVSWGTARQNADYRDRNGSPLRKSHCNRGHPYAPDNRYVNGGCKTCAKARSAAQRQRKANR